MLSAEEFRRLWHDDDDQPLVLFRPVHLLDVTIPFASKRFLLEAGLPDSVAPFLGFETPKNGVLATVAEQWGLSSDFLHYRVIGFNSSGDPVCLDESDNGAVVYLNHDNYFERVLMNSSVPQLAETLLNYRTLVRKSIVQNGEDAFLEGNIPIELRRWFEGELNETDPPAILPGTFWYDEMKGFDFR